jgi:hypothetical protein
VAPLAQALDDRPAHALRTAGHYERLVHAPDASHWCVPTRAASPRPAITGR